MPLSDPMAVVEQRRYLPDAPEPEDFDEFWSHTIGQARAASDEARLEPVRTPLKTLEVQDLTFPGFAGELVHAWVTTPSGTTTPLATVIEFLGYTHGRGLPGQRLFWPSAGMTHVLMDTRGQGSVARTPGSTADDHGAGPSTGAFVTKGIEHPETYYYRRLFTDGVRLVDAVRSLPVVDPARVVVTGHSQGGATALAVAALVDGLAAVMPDAPFLADIPRLVERVPTGPALEFSAYLATHRDSVDAVFRTLSYFDAVHFARRGTAPALFSVAHMDEVVLPSTVYAAFNHYRHPEKEIIEYPFNGHEGGELRQQYRQAEWLAARQHVGSPQAGSTVAP